MSYPAGSTISQIIVFNSAMQAGGTIEFNVDAHAGGGRPLQHDTGNIKIEFYTSSGTLLSTSQTSYNQNLLQMNAWSSGPGDNSEAWVNINLTVNNCGGNCTNVAYMKIIMIGTDTSWWAGNYGPQWRLPSVTFNGGSNLVYNPEFGNHNSTMAQGWTSSSGWGACGTTSGSVMCTTTAAGVTANISGGGYDPNGGTTSSQAGGYSSSLSASNPTAAPPTPPSPVPTAIYNQGVSNGVFITNHYPTSNNSPPGEGPANAFDNDPYTKYLNFDKYNAGVTVKLNVGRIVTGFTLTTANDFPGRDPTSYKLYGSNDGTNWTKVQEGNLNLSNDRFNTSSMISVTNSTSYIYYYIFFPTTKAGDGCGLDCDSMQIAEITFYYDFNNATTSSDLGSGSVVNPSDLCCGGTAAPFNANPQFNNRVSAFESRPYQDSVVSITQIGSNNSAIVVQSGTRNNYSEIYVSGNNNITNTTQASTSPATTNYIELDVLGNYNTVNLTQSSTGGTKGILATVNNSSNNLTINQNGSGNHYAEIGLSGSNKTVSLTQSGSASHMANINLNGGATSLTATQSGNTQQFYSITHSCAQASCAAITVTQGQ